MNKTLPIGLLVVIAMVVLTMIGLVISLFLVARTGLDRSFWFIPAACFLPMLILAIASFGYKFSRIIGKTFTKS